MKPIKLDVGDLKGEELGKAVDEDLKRFNKFFQDDLKNEPLDKVEKAAIKTYVWWKANKDVDAR